MFYRLKLKNGFTLINLALVRRIESVENRVIFHYSPHKTPGSFNTVNSSNDVEFYTYDTPDAAERIREEIATLVTPQNRLI